MIDDNTPPSIYVTRPLEPSDVLGDFTSGVKELDRFFHKHALGNDARGVGNTFVLCDPNDASLPAVVGFYTLSMADLPVDDLPAAERTGLPRYPMPVALIGRLAVDERAHRRGFGEELLFDALRRILTATEQVGCLGVIVDAKNKHAQRFYERYGFAAIERTNAFPMRMFLAIRTVMTAIAELDAAK